MTHIDIHSIWKNLNLTCEIATRIHFFICFLSSVIASSTMKITISTTHSIVRLPGDIGRRLTPDTHSTEREKRLDHNGGYDLMLADLPCTGRYHVWNSLIWQHIAGSVLTGCSSLHVHRQSRRDPPLAPCTQDLCRLVKIMAKLKTMDGQVHSNKFAVLGKAFITVLRSKCKGS